jgi:hypothetical protein
LAGVESLAEITGQRVCDDPQAVVEDESDRLDREPAGPSQFPEPERINLGDLHHVPFFVGRFFGDGRDEINAEEAARYGSER